MSAAISGGVHYDPVYLPFVVQGPWDDPLVFPEVIERFTSGGVRQAAPANGPAAAETAKQD
jgi:hypothetical protein